ncbi:aromatic acid exporter family protein [Virgibacillus sp. DJP39]|uniref:aromatic acid exporter family protein n=1 Tax=Virgibacillus sp. DJP39 TaxID=3409790 RepID=UPI003BB4B930
MKIGTRTIKTALGSGLSMWIAVALGLEFPTSAAILTILCIEKTKKRSIKVSVNRLIACFIGILVSALVFETITYHPFTFTLVVLILLPILVRFKIQQGFVSSTVIILHIFLLENISMPILWNETKLILIGIGVALFMNTYIASSQNELSSYQRQIEKYIKQILSEFSLYLNNGDRGWTGKEFILLEEIILKAKDIALLDYENQLLNKDKKYLLYFQMRERQEEVLKRMMQLISSINSDVVQRYILAEYFEILSTHVTTGNNTDIHMKTLEAQKKQMDDMELPKSREEFITRATLYQLINEIESYLRVKNKFFEQGKNQFTNEMKV